MRLIDADRMNLLLGISDRDIYAKRMLDHMDTVDAVPVTRCKDCKYAYISSFSASSGVALCTSSGQPMQQDDFCSYGERREG